MGGSNKNPFHGVGNLAPQPSAPPVQPIDIMAPALGLYHINTIINGVRHEPPAGLPEWSNGDIEFPVEQQIGTIMKLATGPFPLGGMMTIDYDLSGPIEQMLGSVDRTDYITAGLWFIRRGDRYWSGMPPLEHKTRWYSNAMLLTSPGRTRYSVPLNFSE